MRDFAAALALIIVLMGAPGTRAESPWLGPDKAAHFLLSAGLASSGYAFGDRHLEAPWARVMVGGGIALGLGGAKELADWRGGGEPSLHDLAWDVMGAAAGIVIAALVD
jgi:putative lipoprotein